MSHLPHPCLTAVSDAVLRAKSTRSSLNTRAGSVCNESVNFSLEHSESLLEFPTISRWVHGVFADSLQTESISYMFNRVFQPSPNPCFPVLAAARKSAAESDSADCSTEFQYW